MTSPINVRATQIAEVISIKGNTARMRFGGKMWDVTLEDKGSKVTLNERLADVIQSSFQELCDKKVISYSDKVVVLEGHHENASSESIIIDKVLASQSSSQPVKDVDQSVQNIVEPILKKLSQSLSDRSLFSPTPDNTTSMSSPPDTVLVDIEVDHLTDQFAIRGKTQVTNPFSTLNRILDANTYTKTRFAEFIGKVNEEKTKWLFLKDVIQGNGCENDPYFPLIFSEMKYLYKIAASNAFKSHLQKDKLENLVDKEVSTLTLAEKKALVVSYAKYLKESADTFDAGPSFYKLMIMIANRENPEYNLVAIEDNTLNTPQINNDYSIINQNESINGKKTLFLHLAPAPTLNVSAYNETHPSLINLCEIKEIKKVTEKIALHKDLRDSKTSALKALALQFLEMNGQPTPDENQISRTMNHLRTQLPATIDENLKAKILPNAQKLLQKGLEERSLLSHKMLNSIEEIEKASDENRKAIILSMTSFNRDIISEELKAEANLNNITFTDSEDIIDKIFDSSVDSSTRDIIIRNVLHKKKTEYTEKLTSLEQDIGDTLFSMYLEELKHNPDQDFDKGAFILLAKSINIQIAVLEDNTAPSKDSQPLVLKQGNLVSSDGSSILNPATCLLLYHGADTKYRSVLRDVNTISKMTLIPQ